MRQNFPSPSLQKCLQTLSQFPTETEKRLLFRVRKFINTEKRIPCAFLRTFSITYFARIFLTVCVSRTQERRQYFLIVSSCVEHFLAYTVFDNWHLKRNKNKTKQKKYITYIYAFGYLAINYYYMCNTLISNETLLLSWCAKWE